MRAAHWALLSCLVYASKVHGKPLPNSFQSVLQTRDVLYPHDIQGSGYLSTKNGQTLSSLEGIITAKDRDGCYLQTPDGNWDSDNRTSEGVYVYDRQACSNGTVGSLAHITKAKVSEYRSESAADDLHVTEVISVQGITSIDNQGQKATPVVIGKDRSPPTFYIGTKDPFALPSNTTDLEGGDRKDNLDPETYGADFWESLEGMLVTLVSPTVLGPLTSYNETYILPSGVSAPSQNSRGGLTLAAADSNSEQKWDSNAQAIEIVEALDGTNLDANVVVGDTLADVTGIIGYDFGTYTFVPLTKPEIRAKRNGDPISVPFKGEGACKDLVVATYNVENLPSNDTARISAVGSEIDSILNNPDILVLNEIQDDDGPKDDGIVSANKTLAGIADAIKNTSYDFAAIDPIDNQDGGEPGGNIRPALLWRKDRLSLTADIPSGNATEANSVTSVNGKARLTLNPGRIDPSNDAWKDSRKPLVAQFDLLDNTTIFVIGVHFASKGGSTAPYQNPQAPANSGVEQRIAQAQTVLDFVKRITAMQNDAKILVMGDFNEFSAVQPLAALVDGETPVLGEALVSSRVERYTYIYQQNSQQIDHILASPSILKKNFSVFIPHINTWTTVKKRTSDHDPIAALLNVC